MTRSRRAIIIIASVLVAALIVVGLSFAVAGIRGDLSGGPVRNSATAGATGDPNPGSSAEAPTGGATNGTGGSSGSGTGGSGAGDGTGGSGSGTSDVTEAPGTASGTAKKPVALGDTATVVPKVTVALTDVAGVEGKSDGVGEISGPAMRFTVVFDNGTAKTVDLSTTVVTVTYGADATPSNEIVTARKALPQSVAAGAKAQGTYTFTIPKASRANTRVTVDYAATAPSVVFSGTAPAGS